MELLDVDRKGAAVEAQGAVQQVELPAQFHVDDVIGIELEGHYIGAGTLSAAGAVQEAGTEAFGPGGIKQGVVVGRPGEAHLADHAAGGRFIGCRKGVEDPRGLPVGQGLGEARIVLDVGKAGSCGKGHGRGAHGTALGASVGKLAIRVVEIADVRSEFLRIGAEGVTERSIGAAFEVHGDIVVAGA